MELKEYEVWMEGYITNGEQATASLIGKASARSFKEACHIVMCKSFLESTEKTTDKDYYNPDRWDYDPNGPSYWGCMLYPTEEQARKSFG